MRTQKQAKLALGSPVRMECLEERKLLATPWGYWPTFVGMDKVFQYFPWLDGGGNNVAVIDKGIDYWHPAIGGNRATQTKSPNVVNVYDWRDNDTDPFPSEPETIDASNAHGTGVAGILTANPYNYNGKHYQGILQDTLLYNLRTDRLNSQYTIKYALQWVLANYQKYNITAVNLTDFVGTGSPTPVYDPEVKALYNAGIFIITPVANDWLDEKYPKYPIGYPAKSPYVYGTGGILEGGTINPRTQRGPGLDILAPSWNVSLPYYVYNDGTSIDTDNYTDYGKGNSWGTPHVLGTAVLMQQVDPTIKPQEIMDILQDSGVPVADPDNTGSYVRLDMYSAISLTYTRRDDPLDQRPHGNDDMAHAGLLPVIGGQGSLTNLKLLIGDPDYYMFTITDPEDYKISLGYTGSQVWPTAEVLDGDGNVIGTVGKTGLVKRLSPGTYYLKVTSDTSLVGTYSVFVGDPPAQPGAPGQNGMFNAIEFDSNNYLHFTWFDSVTKRMNYAVRTGSVWSQTQIIDNVADAGHYLSMKVDSNGLPGVAYYDAPNTNLKYAHFNGTSWDVETVDSTYTTGYYPSLQYDAQNRPVIAYYYKTGGNLNFAYKGASAWSISTIDSKGDVGRHASLALSPRTGRWAIAYESSSTGVFKYAEQTRSSWALAVVDANTRAGGGYVSLAFDNAGNPAFSYYDGYNADLKYARFTGTGWATTVLSARGSQGLYTSLFFDPGNSFLPVIYYFNKSANTVMATRSNGAVWEYETLATGGGRQTHVALDRDSFETFSFLEDSTGDVKITAPV